MAQMIFLSILACLLVIAANAAPQQYQYRAHDLPEDEDTRTLRSFPKMSYEEMQVQRYCQNNQDHYWHYCAGSGSFELPVRAKLFKFCPNFEKFCPHMTGKEAGDGSVAMPPPLPDYLKEAVVPLVIPPPLPSGRLNPTMDSPIAFDLPIPSSAHLKHPAASTRHALTPEIVRSCTASCTLPHCTTECKCHYTHPTVHVMCNPPPSGDMVATCNNWYRKCPMFKPVSY